METFDTIAARRNVRVYQDKSIPDADLDRVLEAARRSPSASNRQWWDLVVVTDREQLQALAQVWRGASHVAGSAATVAIVAPKPQNERDVNSTHFDLGQLAMTMILAATDLGIGTGHTSVGDQAMAQQILKFPDTHFLAWLVAMGYPEDRPMTPLKKHNRRPFEEVVHRGTW